MEQSEELNPFDLLAQEVRKVIDDNSKFLARLSDESYEPDDDSHDEMLAEEL